MINKIDLTTQLRTHGLVQFIASLDLSRKDDRDELVEKIAEVLNESGAPPINLHIEKALRELEGPSFFLVQHMLCDLIPLLQVDQGDLLSFTARLLDKGGNDLVAGAPSKAFGEWTKKVPARSLNIYDAVRSGDSLALNQLYTVLLMNVDVNEGIAFAQAPDREARLAAISALGAMELGERYREVMDILLQLASSKDESIRLRALEAAFRSSGNLGIITHACFDKQLEVVLREKSTYAIHLAADLLWRYRDGLSEDALQLCLTAIAVVDPNNVGTISHIDHALYKLVLEGRTEQVVRLLGELIDRSKGRVTLDVFQSTYYSLVEAGTDVIGNAVVYWLLNGESYICACITKKVCSIGNDAPSFSISLASLPSSSSEQLLLCYKAIGWFFLDPLAAAEIPLAVLRYGSQDIANEVLELIYDPLLLSYGSKLEGYIERTITINDANGDGINKLIAKKANFKNELEGIECLVELHPSEMQREAERVRWSEKMERGMEQGRKKSFFADLFSKQYILYGNSSLTPVYTGEGATSFTEIEMKSFSVSSELPLLDIVDPVGLNNRLSLFKYILRR